MLNKDHPESSGEQQVGGMELGEQHLVDSPEHPGEQQLGEPGGQQLAGGPSPCQLGHGDEAGGQRRREGRKQSLDGQGSR